MESIDGRIKERTYPDKASLPSGENAVLKTHDVCPTSAATAPPPPFPFSRTSKSVNLLSSEAERRREESGDQARDRTVVACAVYVWRSVEDAMSNM